MAKEKLLRRGAEAEIFKTKWHSTEAIKKVRISKKYRNAKLDLKLRSTRTRIEASLLHKAKLLGIRAPALFHIDLEKSIIIMEYIKGGKAKDCIEKNATLCRKIAKSIAVLHNAGLIHGDLTMDNIIVHNNEPAFVDFGLGFYSHKIEDKATDMLNLKKSLLALKPGLEKEWRTIINSYRRSANNGKQIVKRMHAIEARARYV